MKGGRFVPTAQAPRGTKPDSAAGLHPELLKQSARRVGLAALLYAALYLAAYCAGMLGLLINQFPVPSANPAVHIVPLASILLSLLVFGLVRSGRLEAALAVDVGLLYWVVGALGLDLAFYYWLFTLGLPAAGLSWACLWIVFFPLLVPAPPRKTLIACLAAASMGPLAWTALRLALDPQLLQAQPNLFNRFFPYYLCAALAYAASRILYQLSQDASQAREMGSYRLEKKLGSGGMGDVWLAKHRLLARPAAVKLVHPRRLARKGFEFEAIPSVMARFEREARATANLRSPHTIELYDYGIAEDGTFFYVMEYLEGLDLNGLVNRGGVIEGERVAYLLIQACESLQEAHSQGLIHRDIKPGNIYLCKLGPQYDFVKVLDFGLVSRPQGDVDATRLTAQGVTLGTPGFMAPEMIRGQKIDARADLYSLGCVGYFLLTGDLVFEGLGMKALVAHLKDTPVPPSTRSGKEIAADLENVILDCLEKNPASRPRSARELAGRLRSCRFPQAWTQERARQWWSGRKSKSQRVKESKGRREELKS